MLERLTKLVDLKSKVPEFSGLDQEFEEYRWRLELLIGTISKELQSELKLAASWTVQQIQAVETNAATRERSLILFKLLAAGC